jgi:hypothetical protein
MGYAQVFVLPAVQLEAFRAMTGCRVEPGEILIIEPNAFGGHVHRFPYEHDLKRREKMHQQIDVFTQNYPRRKEIDFGNCLFINAAKDMAQQLVIGLHRSIEDTVKAYEERLRVLEDQRRQEEYDLRASLLDKDTKISRLQDKIEELALEKQEVRTEMAKKEEQLLKQQAMKERSVQRQIYLQERPQKPADVPGWVERFFGGKMLFHERAKDMMQKITPDRVNLPLLCDALEFLAEEYRDELLGQLDEVELNRLCSEKYGRPFEVISDKGPSVEMYKAEYKIRYYIGHKGKPVESALDLHLKVGNDPDNLLRIYFLYDKDKKLIVVGSLPEHLRTVSYR